MTDDSANQDPPSAPRYALPIILGFLALNFLAPLSYYTTRSDKHDERFAWRMFSPTLLTECNVNFRIGPDPKPIRTSKYFHPAWQTLATRGRAEVIDAMAATLCSDHAGQAVRVSQVCRYVDGKQAVIHTGRKNACHKRGAP